MISYKSWTTLALTAIACAALTACGGGGGSGGASGTTVNGGSVSIQGGPFTATSTDSLSIMANASTEQTILQSMKWTVVPKDPTAPALTLANADCASAVRNDVKYPSNGQASTGKSDWACAVSLAASPKMVVDSTYVVSVSVTDDKSNTRTASADVKFTVNSGNGNSRLLAATAGGNYTVAPGATAPLSCQATGGTGPYSYAWMIKDNAGYPLTLSSFSSAQSSFVAPSVSVTTNIVMECLAVDSNSISAKSTVTIGVVPTASAKPLSATAGGNYTLAPLATAPLSCAGSGGTAPYTYVWKVLDNANLPIALSSYSSAQSSFVAPTIKAATPIMLQCEVTDAKSVSAASTMTVTVAPNGNLTALSADAGLPFSTSPGKTEQLQCSAAGGVSPYSYQWKVTSNSGFNVPLGSYNSASTSFTAPPVVASSVVSFQCVATDSSGTSASSTVSATVSSSSSGNLVANAGNGLNVNPGQTVALDGTASGWFDNSGNKTTGTSIVYSWSTTYAGVVINNPASASTTFVAPTSITTATTIPFTLTTTAGASTSTATVNFLVDPFAPFSLSITPPAQAALLGTAATITANGNTSNGKPTLYYQWTQISGPVTAVLGGQSTSSLGFVPSVAGTYVFRVAVGYQPINAGYSGIYFGEATVTAN